MFGWSSTMRGVGGALLFAALVITPMGQVRAQALAIDKVLAVVNNEPITLREYQARHQREALEQALDIAPFTGEVDERLLNLMIDERIQTQHALQQGLRVTRGEVDRAMAYIAGQRNSTPEELLAYLNQNGITTANFRASLQRQQLNRKLIELAVHARVQVSDGEIENFMARHPQIAASDEAYEISHLLISLRGKSETEKQRERENLENIRQGVLQGQEFGKMVQQFSDNANAEQGGYLGWQSPRQLPDLFINALRGMREGGVSGIIDTGDALHLLRLHGKRGGKQMIRQQRLRHILIVPEGGGLQGAKAIADELYQRIQAGEDFMALARGYSADQNSVASGGDLGWVVPGDFSPAFEAAASRLQDGEVSMPVQTPIGFHLIQAVGSRQHDISVEIAKRRTRQLIFQRKAEEVYENWFGALRENSYIEYLN